MAESNNQITKQEEKIWSAISYLWILSLVVLAARKNNNYIRFHANQGLLLFVLSLVFFITGPFVMILNLILGIITIFGIIKALQGERWELPVVGSFAKSLGDWVVKTLKI